MTYLVSTKEIYRVDYEEDVAAMIEDAKNSDSFELKGYSCKKKETKEDEWFQVTLDKVFTEEKSPTLSYTPSYNITTGEF